MSDFLWFDLETYGRDPRRTRIAQFAAIRTDAALNVIEEPISFYCRPADDLLPSPEAALLTGIVPQDALRDGLPEAEFASAMHAHLARPGTCAVGYNSLRFDDEFVRFTLYRNFFDPYEREWRGGNSRWDLLDLMRLAWALRPQGMEWPLRPDGMPSFRLEDLASANGLTHVRAHEALSDVEALIGLARKLRGAQPKLFDYYFALRDKRRAAGLLDYIAKTPVLHVSGKYPASRGCGALVLPLAPHPHIGNRIIVADLDPDPTPLLTLSPEDIADRLYTPAADLPEGEQRIALKEVHLNRCPALVELRHLDATQRARFGIDLERAERHAALLRASDTLVDTVRAVYGRPRSAGQTDPDQALYDGFASDADRARFVQVRRAGPRAPVAGFGFQDAKFEELAFRYRARNWPESLDADDAERWSEYRHRRLDSDIGLSEYSFESYFAEIAALRIARGDEPDTHARLDALDAWGRRLQALA
ncbi:exodeoxyribonuclease I [Chiayiivirga flava]|uniref:Exodeoxyribonuclease I n=1 Tax=Chiayiivirga flava TaxID=659595 RepID=A0A7W8FZG2_9GAMM|nr:exodeoxyribonuclease-1 [Chiayiivirga flava]